MLSRVFGLAYLFVSYFLAIQKSVRWIIQFTWETVKFCHNMTQPCSFSTARRV
jgi:hypothetical protein